MSSAFAIDIPVGLIRRAQCGETVAFKAIYDTFERPAYTLALRLCQCPDVAQDVLQDGMLLVFRKIDHYRFDAPFWGWLRKVFLRACLLELRKQQRWGRWQNEIAVHQADREVPGYGADRDLERGLARLSAVRRAALWLHAVEGYSHAEVAKMLGVSEANSRAHVSRARSELRQWWNQAVADAPAPANPLGEDLEGMHHE